MSAWRKTLRDEDSETLKWYERNGCSYHPYGRFAFADEPEDENEAMTRAEVRKIYPAERARNELFWCLCRDTDVIFVPQTSNLFPLEKWSEWLGSVSTEGMPPYWPQHSPTNGK